MTWTKTTEEPRYDCKGLRKIAELDDKLCLSPEHNPPGNMVLGPGIYEYTCPVCRNITVFTVPRVSC